MKTILLEFTVAGLIVMFVLPVMYNMFSSVIPNFNPFYFALIGIFILTAPPLLLYLGSYNPIKKIIVKTVETWSETSGGFFSVSTHHHAKINGKYVIDVENPYEVKKGDKVFVGQNRLGMEKIIKGDEYEND